MEAVVDKSLKTVYAEQRHAILRSFSFTKTFSPNHSLQADIYGIYNVGELASTKLFPIIIAMWETRDDEYLTDFYSFDHKGICLSHGYSRVKNGKPAVSEQHDTDTSRLVEHKKTFREAIKKEQSVSPALYTEEVIMNLFLSDE